MKSLKKVRIEGTYANINKAIYKESKANMVLNWVKLKECSLKFRNRQVCPLSPLLFNIMNEVLALPKA